MSLACGQSQAARAPRRTRQMIRRDPPALEVPDINDDATERKRVLNVLAQRRYRQRKKQGPGKEDRSVPETDSRVRSSVQGQAVAAESLQAKTTDQPVSLPTNHSLGCGPGSGVSGLPLGNAWMPEGIGSFTETSELSLSPLLTIQELPSEDNGRSGLEFGLEDIAAMLEQSSSSSSFGPCSLDLTDAAVSEESLSFPDTYLLPVPELTLIRAMMRIAFRLGCTSTIWDIRTLSPFNNPDSCASTAGLLPETWRPTATQAGVPHHPVLDLIPWPSARDRLIGIFDLPESVRPPSAMGLADFVYDMEDTSEGLRLYGGNPYDPDCWEVGQTLFQKWWFVFDHHIVNQSNRWRRLRGASALRLEAAPSDLP